MPVRVSVFASVAFLVALATAVYSSTIDHSNQGNVPTSLQPSGNLNSNSTGAVATHSNSNDTPASCAATSQLLSMNGSTFCAIDISSDIAIENPGYSYFLNQSVDFMGIRFVTWCPSAYAGCPGQSNGSSETQTALYTSAIRMSITFPDRTSETIGAVIGDASHLLLISKHTDPHAGLSIQFVSNGYSASYRVLLLVEDLNPPSS